MGNTPVLKYLPRHVASMATLAEVRVYGGVGAILTLLFPVPSVGWLLALAGFILTLIAVKFAADILKDPSIMESMLVSISAAIASVVAGVIVILATLVGFFGASHFFDPAYWSGFNPSAVPVSHWVGLAGSLLVGLVVIWGLMLVSGVFFRRGFNRMGASLGVRLFGTAGLIFLIGAATTIVLVGFLLIPVALIILAVAFFSIREPPPAPQAPAAAAT